MVRESFEPGKAVSMVAHWCGVDQNRLFHWRKLHRNGNLSAVSVGQKLREDDKAQLCCLHQSLMQRWPFAIWLSHLNTTTRSTRTAR